MATNPNEKFVDALNAATYGIKGVLAAFEFLEDGGDLLISNSPEVAAYHVLKRELEGQMAAINDIAKSMWIEGMDDAA